MRPAVDHVLRERGVAMEFPPKAAPRIRLIPFSDIKLGNGRRDLVKGIIPRVGLAIVWGPPKCGKSFWVFDLSMHVALGWEYRGRRVQRGTVVYCAFEGQTGMEARAAAFRQRFLKNDEPVTFFLQPLRLNLIADVQELIEAVQHQMDDVRPALIVLDTLNRSFAGSESSDEDMTAYVDAADALRERFNCAVVIVHHCGIDGSRTRGHTSLTGATDVQASVKRDASDNIVVEIELAKDGPQGDKIVSRLEVVEVGADEDGEPITSCVVVPSDADGTEPGRRRVSGAAGVALNLLRRAVIDAGEAAPAGTHFPRDIHVVRKALWRTYCYDGKISDGDNQDTKKKAFNRAANHLQSIGMVGSWGDFVWLA